MESATATNQYVPAPPSMEAYPPDSAAGFDHMEYQPAANPTDHKGYQPMNPIAQPPPAYCKFTWLIYTFLYW